MIKLLPLRQKGLVCPPACRLTNSIYSKIVRRYYADRDCPFGPPHGDRRYYLTDSTNAHDSSVGTRLLKAIETISISPADAKAIAEGYINQSKERFPELEDWDHRVNAADKIVGRYSRLAALVGTASGLPGVIPGLGTAVSIVGGATADSLVCMKLQVDMCMCLAAAFNYDINSEDGKHLAFLIAATGSAQRAGVKVGAQVGSKAGVRMIRQYLKGAALQAVKQAFRRVGVTFTRKAVERAIPFGIGAAIGGAANYGLTRYVGRQAKQWFIIDLTSESGGMVPSPNPE